MRKVYCNITDKEKRIAIVEDKELVEVMIEGKGEESILGNIYMGRVENIVKGMDAAFINIGLEQNAYLRNNEMLQEQKLLGGQYVLVQVKKESASGKGPSVTCNIEFTGEYIVYMPYDDTIAPSKKIKREREKWVELGKEWCSDGEGILLRSACAGTESEKVYQEFQLFKGMFVSLVKTRWKKGPGLVYRKNSLFDRLLQVYPKESISQIEVDCIETVKELREKVGREKVHRYKGKENIFSSYLLDIEIDKGLKQIVPLDKGAFLLFEQMETMTVIDVNTGKYIGKGNMEDTAVKINHAAIMKIVTELRLRNVGGMILIDFINMKEECNRKKIINTLKKELKKDRLQTNIYGFTKLGILEMTRKRVGKSLREQLLKKCETCQGTGYVFSGKNE